MKIARDFNKSLLWRIALVATLFTISAASMTYLTRAWLRQTVFPNIAPIADRLAGNRVDDVEIKFGH
jgi:hypothetical protein